MHKTDRPDESTIERELLHFRPEPDDEFYRKAAATPWLQNGEAANRRSFTRTRARRTLRLAVASFIAVALCISVLGAPQLRAIAQDLLGLIAQQPDDIVTAEERNAASDAFSEDDWTFIDPYQRAIAEIEAALGFDVWAPQSLPLDYHFEYASYYPPERLSIIHFSQQSLRSADGVMSAARQPDFSLIQQDADFYPIMLVNEVGASAEIEILQIGDLEGEYVEGAWCGPSSTAPMEWCADINARFLVWQQGDFVFTLHAYGAPDEQASLDKHELVGIANNVTTEYEPFWQEGR